MSRIDTNALKNLETNSVSRSEVMWARTPCLENTSFTKISASPTALIDLQVGMNMACLVSLSTTTRMSVYPRDLGSCSMKSIDMDSQGWGGMDSCWSRP